MDKDTPKYPRILAVSPSSAGFGFAVLEGQNVLVKSGSVRVPKDRNKGTLARAEKLMAEWTPQVIVLEDASAEGSLRHPRIRRLTKMICRAAQKRRIKVALISRKRLMEAFFPEGEDGERHELAEAVAQMFPEELTHRLPSKRKFYESENYRIEMFFAVALALMLRYKKGEMNIWI